MRSVFFGLQIAVRSPAGDPWRRQLGDFVRAHTKDLPMADTRALLGGVANRLLWQSTQWTLGFWDFLPDGEAAHAEWVQGIEDDSAETWQPDRGAPLDHALVSVLLLAPEGSVAAEFLAERCDLQQAMWQRRASYRWLAEGLARVPVAGLRSASVFVTPGSLDTAFSRRELAGAGYEYLQPIA